MSLKPPDLASVPVNNFVSVLREAPLNVQYPEYGARGDDSTNDTAALNLAIAALPSRKGELFLPRGVYRHTGLNFDSTSGVRLVGESGVSGGASVGSTLKYTGAGSYGLSAKSSFGLVLENLQFVYTNASFTGKLVDLSSTTTDTSYAVIQNCLFAGSGTSSATALLSLNKAIITTVNNCVFTNGAVGVKGRDTSGDYANVIRLENCTFVSLTTAGVQNAGQAWAIDSCTFEQLASGAAGGYLGTSFGGSAMSFRSCWFGDANSSGTWIAWAGNGLLVEGSYISTGATGISLGASSFGASIKANAFDTITTGVSVGASCTGVEVDPSNGFNVVGTPISTADTAPGSVLANGTYREVRGIPAVSVYNSANQSLADSTTTALTWDTEFFDSGTLHSISSNTSRLVAPFAGKYLVSASVIWAANTTGTRQVLLRHSSGTAFADSTVTAAVSPRQVVSGIVSLAAGEYVEVTGFQSSGGALNVMGANNLSRASMVYLGL